MIFTIQDPVTKTGIEIDARPEHYHGEPAWRIHLPSQNSFVMIERNGEWQVMDNTDINPELSKVIGKALHPAGRYNHLSGAEGL